MKRFLRESAAQRLLKGCLEKDPGRRLRDIGDAWRLLEEAPALPVASRSQLGTVAWVLATVAVGVASALAFVHFREKPATTEVVRFQIPLPPQTSFTFGVPHVSPDGRRLAFLAGNAAGHTQLWVRSLDSFESHPLAGTEGAFNTAFWSPDSRTLGFVLEGKLKRVDVSGGPPQTVCDLPVAVAVPGQRGTFRAGSWNRDGVIIFGTASTGLWRVSAGGGPLTEVTKLDPSRKEMFHAGPEFLPDGRQFFYERLGPDAGDVGIYLGSLDVKPEQQSSERLLTSASSVVYVPAADASSSVGYLLFSREGSLLAQPFDLRQQRLVGDAVSIAEGMSFGGPRTFSASMTGVLAYRTGGYAEFDAANTQLTWFDRGGKVLSTAGGPGQYSSVALSPDETRVAVGRVSPQTDRGRTGRPAYDIWVHEFARGTNTRLTSDPASDWLATWSPDGSRVAFSSERGGPVFNLYQKASSGAGSEDLVFGSSEDKSVLDWSPDGRFLLYSVPVNGRRSYAPAASHDLWVLPLTQRVPKPELYLKTEFDETQGRFSPDSHLIAYASNASGRYEIYVQPFPTALGGKTTVSRGGGVAPRWSGNGKELFYISADSKMMAVEVSSSPVFRAGVPKALFQAPISGGGTNAIVTRYDVTADGKRFLINSVPDAGTEPARPLMVVLNWTSLLRR